MIQEITLNIKQDKDGFQGTVIYDNNLIVVDGDSIASLEQQAANCLRDFHELGLVKFKHKYI